MQSDLPPLDERPKFARSPSLSAALLLTALCLLPTLRFDFVYDDTWTIVKNGFLREPNWAWLVSDAGRMAHVPDVFRPTLVAFDVFSYRLLGLNRPAHHALSGILHLACVASYYLCLRSWRVAKPTAGWAALLFGLLAIHAEAVAVVSFREDLLAALFSFLSLTIANRLLTANWRSIAWQVPALFVATALACGAKWSAAPVVLVWCAGRLSIGRNITASWRKHLAILLVFFAGIGLVVWQNYIVQQGIDPYDASSNLRIFASRVGHGPVLARSVQIVWTYFQQVLVPIGLSPEYVDRGAAWTDLATVSSLVALFVSLSWSLLHAKKHPCASFGCLAFFLWLIPVANLAPMPNMQAERFVYLPSMAITLLLAPIAAKWAASSMPGRRHLVVVLSYCLLQGAVFVGQMRAYAHSAGLWEQAIRNAPDSARAQAVVAIAKLQAADFRPSLDPSLAAMVEAQCAIASALDSQYELPLLCWAQLELAKKNWNAAANYLEAALRVSPDRNDSLLAKLAQVTLDRDDLPPEERTRRSNSYLARARIEYPMSPDVFEVAARLAHLRGEAAAALDLAARAQQLAPERWQPSFLMAEIRADVGDLRCLREILRDKRGRLRGVNPILRESLYRRSSLLEHRRLFAQDADLADLPRCPGEQADEP